jgi:Alcohol dehydrogenase transcription factor Myb/SANT-like
MPKRQQSQQQSKSPTKKVKKGRKNKPRSAWQIEWTEEISEDLINFYRETPCLWNFQLASYRDRSKKQSKLENWVKGQNFLDNLNEDEIRDKCLGKLLLY